jgi:hypothetical protein
MRPRPPRNPIREQVRLQRGSDRARVRKRGARKSKCQKAFDTCRQAVETSRALPTGHDVSWLNAVRSIVGDDLSPNSLEVRRLNHRRDNVQQQHQE